MLERAIENIDSKEITQKNKDLIKDFIYFLSANGVGKLRREKYIYGLQHVAEWLNIDFDKASKTDIQRVCGILETKMDFTEWTKHDLSERPDRPPAHRHSATPATPTPSYRRAD